VTTEWLGLVPSGDGAELAVVLRSVQWTLDDLAHDLPAGRATPQRMRDLATLLRRLAAHLDTASGIVPANVESS
jgi:hypothetical protein